MSANTHIPEQNKFTLQFVDKNLEKEFTNTYDESIKLPLRYGIIISILSWFSAIALIYIIIPEQMKSLAPITVAYIGSYFGFIIYATYRPNFKGYYHLLGAISNAWAGLFAIYFCHFFPNGENLMLPVLIFIIFFGSYMVRLRWQAGFIAALSYTIGYQIYIIYDGDLSGSQVLFNSFVAWMTLVFALLAGRVAEANNRISYIQRKMIKEQGAIIEREKEVLLKEVHHRVKNNLQIIVSLINLQISKFDNPTIEVALKETQSRVVSMSLVHQRMHQTTDFSNISVQGYVEQLVNNVQFLFTKEPVKYQLNIDESIMVDVETAVPLGLMINEIISNFYKHCWKGNETFTIDIVQVPGSKNYMIRYKDDGEGFPENLNIEGMGALGIELIDTLTEKVEGSFKTYNDQGAVYEITLEM